MDRTVLDNDHPVSNFSSLSEALEAPPLKAVWDDTDYLHLFQSGFWPGYRTENTLGTGEWIGGAWPCWFFWTSQWVSVPPTTVSFWVAQQDWVSETQIYSGPSPFWKDEPSQWCWETSVPPLLGCHRCPLCFWICETAGESYPANLGCNVINIY